ncbi:MAG: hypothetical protein ACR2L4_09170 [Actinomycetota bacterium]
MDRERTVQVVLGEAERTGILRFVLEGEGFDIIGMASSDEELERVLVGARPSVIVLDGGISAAAALEARERATGASMVVVWPAGVAAVLAEERVDPHLVIEELGAAVRRASKRAEDRAVPIRIPEFLEAAPPIEERRVAPAPANQGGTREPARPSRTGSRVLVAAATWIVVLTALTTIAVAVPNALDLFDEDRTPRRSPSPAETRRPDDRTVATGSERPGETGRSARCEPPRGADGRADRSRDPEAPAVRANGCPQDRGSRAGGDRGQGESGKPDDPGSQGNKGEAKGNRGEAEGKENPSDGRFTDDEKHESGGEDKQGGAVTGRVGDPGRSSEARSDRDPVTANGSGARG